MKKSVKDFSEDTVSKDVVSRKKRKGGVLKDGIVYRVVLPDQPVGGSWGSEASNITELDSVDMEGEFLIEETSVDYGERDVLERMESNQMPKDPRLVTKQALSKPLGKINFLGNDKDDDILLDEPVDKLAVVRKLFSKINSFGGASTLSKFSEIIQVLFTSKSSLIKATKLAANVKILVNTNFKKSTGCSDWAVVLKKIPVGTSAEAVHAALSEFGTIKSIKMQLVELWQKAIVEFEKWNQADLLAARWSILIGKNVVHVNIRDHYRVLFYIFSMRTNAHDVWDFISSVGGKTCVINCHPVTYTQARCAVVCFESAESLDAVMGTTPVLKGVHLCWFYLGSAMCTKYEKLSHTSLSCVSGEKSSSSGLPRQVLSNADKDRLVAIYTKHLAPVARPIVGGFFFSLFSVQNSLVNAGSSSEMKPTFPVMSDLKIRFAKLDLFVLAVFQPSPRYQLSVTPLSQNQVGDVVMEEGSGGATSGNTAAILVSSAFSEVKRLKNMLEKLSTSVLSLTARFDDFVWKIAMCNVYGMNNLAKQDNVIHWHKDIDNLISIFTESKLKEKIHPWIVNRFDGVQVFTSGLDSGYLSAGVAVVINNSLVKHICKVSKVPGQLISIRLLFRNKLLVSILGLYAGASSVIRFSQAGNINSLIAKAVNNLFFIILGGDFNKNRSHKCASYKKCFDLNLVNSLNGSPVAKALTWSNSCGVLKTINYLFIFSNLINTIVNCNVVDVMDHFDTDHKTVSVSVDLASTAANAVMFSNEFSSANIICKIMVLSADGTFKKKWFKSFNSVFTKVFSRFHKLGLLVSKLVKTSHSVSSDDFVSLLKVWDRLDFTGVSAVKFFLLLGSNFDVIRSVLAKAKKLYCSSKLLESKHTEESSINVLERSFCKVVLDHLVVGNELILEPDLVKPKVDEIMKGWTRKRRVVSDPLNYVFDGAFSGVMCSISFDEMSVIVKELSDGKAAGLSGISNELWKQYDKSVLDMLLVLLNFCLSMTTQFPIFTISSVVEDALEKNQELWLVLQDMHKTYDSVDWEHLRKSLARLTSFFATGAFVDNMIWVGSSQAITQHILDVTSEFFRFNDISINNDKMVAIPINCQVANLYLTISGLPIFIAKKGEYYHYLGIYLSTETLSRPSLFFANFVLKKVVLDKLFAYLVSAILFLIVCYRMQFSYIPLSVCNKWNAMICKGLKSKTSLPLNFPNDVLYHPSLYGLRTFEQIQTESKSVSVGLLGHLFFHRSYDLQVLSWCPHHLLQFPVHIKICSTNNFLAGVVCILSGCNLSLGGSFPSAFCFHGGSLMSLVLGEHCFSKYVSSLYHYSVAFMEQLRDQTMLEKTGLLWPSSSRFDLSIQFLSGVVSSSFVCLPSVNGHALFNVLQSHNFGVVCDALLNINAAVSLSVYTDRSLSGLGTVSMKAGAAAFFEDIHLGLGVRVSGIVSSMLVELQAIVLALECIPPFRSVDLFSDSQAALDTCESKSLLIHLDFRNQYWIECYHIIDAIQNKNLNVNWVKIKGHSGVLSNEQADALTKTAASSSW
ncbi:hypothetical protein G9A89_009352 [Geosiphon pyriformis]|nr:hypothetical protein G9A89_009352 [Geosiphon pyriformis]